MVWAIGAGTMFYFEKEERFSWISSETMAAGRDCTLAKTAGNPYDRRYFSTNCSFRQDPDLNMVSDVRILLFVWRATVKTRIF